MKVRIAVVGIAAAALAASGAALWHGRARVRHLALPVLAVPASAAPAAVEPGTVPPCRIEEVARVGRRITALLPASDGVLWVGTFDDGLLRIEEGGAPAPVGPLAGRERFVNALAEHDGVVWAATQGGLMAFDEERRILKALEGEGVTALARAGGGLYAGTARGLFRASIDEGAEPVPVAGPSGEPLRVTALAATAGDARGGVGGARLWIGTSSGAYSLPLATLAAPLLSRTAAWHPLVFGDPPAETNVVTALAPLGDGVVAGTDDGGIVRLREGGAVSALRFSDPRANEVNPGAAAPSGSGAALGTQGGGLLLARVRGAALEASRPAGLDRVAVSAVWAGPEALLVGTAEGTVLRLACEPVEPRAEAAGSRTVAKGT